MMCTEFTVQLKRQECDQYFLVQVISDSPSGDYLSGDVLLINYSVIPGELFGHLFEGEVFEIPDGVYQKVKAKEITNPFKILTLFEGILWFIIVVAVIVVVNMFKSSG